MLETNQLSQNTPTGHGSWLDNKQNKACNPYKTSAKPCVSMVKCILTWQCRIYKHLNFFLLLLINTLDKIQNCISKKYKKANCLYGLISRMEVLNRLPNATNGEACWTDDGVGSRVSNRWHQIS